MTTDAQAPAPAGASAREQAAGPGGPFRDGLPRTAITIAVVAWVLALVSLGVLIAARPHVDELMLFYVVDATDACVYGTVAAVTLSRRQHPVSWILAVTSVGGGLAALAFAWTMLSIRHPDVPAPSWFLDLQGQAWVPGTIALFTAMPYLVRDSRLTRTAIAGLLAGTFVTVLVSGWSFLELTWDTTWVFGLVVGGGFLAAAEVGWRRLRGPEAERIGLGWLAIGTLIITVTFLPLLRDDGFDLPLWVTPSLHIASQAFFPAAILVVILRQRLWGLDLAVSRTVVVSTLAVGLVALYIGVVSAVDAALPWDGAARVLAAAAVAVAVQPSRLWLNRRVRRLIYGAAVEPRQALRGLGTSLGDAGSVEELLDGLAANVAGALRLESVTLLLDGEVAASSGTPTSPALIVPLTRGETVVGELAVTAPPGETLDSRARRALDEVLPLVTTGVALARAQTRLASVRTEERRVLRRELHDGLGPSLAGIRLGLQGARNLVGRDPAQAEQLLAALQDELDGRVEDVRALSRSLLPPTLDTAGLGPALDELAARHREGGLAVEVHCEEPALRGDLAAAIYGIAVEGLMNVARHSGAQWARVAVHRGPVIVLRIDDDGRGFPPDAPPGVGTRSMRERAEEQGGTFSIRARHPVGTRVEAGIPLRGGAAK